MQRPIPVNPEKLSLPDEEGIRKSKEKMKSQVIGGVGPPDPVTYQDLVRSQMSGAYITAKKKRRRRAKEKAAKQARKKNRRK